MTEGLWYDPPELEPKQEEISAAAPKPKNADDSEEPRWC